MGAIALLLVAGRFAWIGITGISTSQESRSPDQRYTIKIDSQWRDPFWGGKTPERHQILVKDGDQVIRRVTIVEPWTGWPRDSFIHWSADGAAVTLAYKTEEALGSLLTLAIRP